ncbi:tetratricopeptide repeat protein [candidate division WOR-3 bacterium]|nr:tetratricopeptide repeat protein [candidate division WOR-3 bacterium]
MKCASCGFENPEKSNYCANCGAFLKKISAQEERKLASILFADLSGFTELSHSLEPEEVADIIRASSETINPIILKNGGLILGYQGDSVIAVFGIPKSGEDDPEKSVKCALEILDSISSINFKIFEITGKYFKIGIHAGINSGIIAWSETGSPYKNELTALGDTVNLASRIMNLAMKNEIYVSENIFRQTRHFADYGRLETYCVKGIKEEIRVYKLRGLKKEPSSKRSLAGIDKSFIGRSGFIDKLRQFINERPEKDLSAAVIWGDAGIGKTRFIMEYQKSQINGKNDLVFFLQCPPMSESLMNSTLVKFLEMIFGIQKKETEKQKKNKIIKKIKSFSLNMNYEKMKFIYSLMSLEPDLELHPAENIDPGSLGLAKPLGLEAFSAVKEILTALCQKKKVYLIIDDSHWIDGFSAAFLSYLSENWKRLSMDLILLSRIEKKGHVKEISDKLIKNLHNRFLNLELDPLDISQSKEVLNSLIPDDRINYKLKQKILQKAGGNPFFLEEIARHLLEAMAYTDTSGRNSLSDDKLLPDSVVSVLYSRIDMLDPVQKNILRAASVAGSDLNESLLAHLVRQNLGDVKKELSSLSDLQFLTKLNGCYSFKHNLVQEVAYKTIIKKQKKELHESIAKYLKKLDERKKHNYNESLSLHFFKSEKWENSFKYSIVSAENALAKFQNEFALKFCEQAQICAVRLGDESRLVKALLIKSKILTFTGNNAEALNCAKKCLKLAKKINVPEIASACDLLLSGIYSMYGNYENSQLHLSNAMKFFKQIRDLDGQADCQIMSGRIFYLRSDFRKSLLSYKKALNVYLETKNTRGIFRSYNLIGLIYFEMSNMENSLHYQIKASKVLKKKGDRFDRSRVLTSIAFVYYKLHKYSKALDFYKQSMAIKNEIGDRPGVSYNLAHIGILYLYMNDYSNARNYLENSLEILRNIGDLKSQANVEFYIGILHLRMGKLNLAKKTLSKALRVSKTIGDRQSSSECLYTLGLVEAEKGKFDNAEKLFRESLKSLKAIGDVSECGKVITMWARVNSDSGNFYSAKRNLEKSMPYLGKFSENNFVYHSVKTTLALEREDTTQALENLQKAEKWAKILDTDHFFAEYYLLSAQVFEFIGKNLKAEKSYTKASVLFEKIDEPLNLAKSFYLHGKFLKKTIKSDQYTKRAQKIYRDLKIPFWISSEKTAVHMRGR